nr:hypothetical protein [Tanacetum cinerariifolium]
MDILAEHAARKAFKLELQSSFKSSPIADDVSGLMWGDWGEWSGGIYGSSKHAPLLANPKPKAPKLKPFDVTESDQGDGSGGEEGDGSGSEEEGDEEEDEKKVDEEEDEEEG